MVKRVGALLMLVFYCLKNRRFLTTRKKLTRRTGPLGPGSPFGWRSLGSGMGRATDPPAFFRGGGIARADFFPFPFRPSDHIKQQCKVSVAVAAISHSLAGTLTVAGRRRETKRDLRKKKVKSKQEDLLFVNTLLRSSTVCSSRRRAGGARSGTGAMPGRGARETAAAEKDKRLSVSLKKRAKGERKHPHRPGVASLLSSSPLSAFRAAVRRLE